MKNWNDLSDLEKTEWLRQETTQAAIEMLRLLARRFEQAAFTSAQSEPVELVRFKAVITIGVREATEALTRAK